jgi:hypothetical protein
MTLGERIRGKFQRVFLRQLLMAVLVIPILFPLLRPRFFYGALPFLVNLDSSTRFLALAIVIAGAFAFSALNWRCPACRRYLGRNTFVSECPRCGVELRG